MLSSVKLRESASIAFGDEPLESRLENGDPPLAERMYPLGIALTHRDQMADGSQAGRTDQPDVPPSDDCNDRHGPLALDLSSVVGGEPPPLQ